MSQESCFLDAEEQIQLNTIHMEVASQAATDLLKNSQSQIGLNEELPQDSIVIAVHALLTQAHYDGNTIIPLLRKSAGSLEVISEKHGDLAESLDFLAATTQADQKINMPVSIIGLPADRVFSALLMAWESFNPAAERETRCLALQQITEYSGV